MSQRTKPTTPIRLTVGNLKGGVGRSTTSVELALALHRLTGEVVHLVDADGANGTTYEWSEMAGEDWPSGIVVQRWPSTTLAKRVRDSGHEGHIIIDTAPHDASVLRQALMVTDQLVMPMNASLNELTRVQPTLAAAAEVAINRPIELSVLFTRVRPNSVDVREAREAFASEGHRVLEHVVTFKNVYSQAYGTVPDDLGVYPDVLDELVAIGA